MGRFRVVTRLSSVVVALALLGVECDESFFIAGLVNLSGPAQGSTRTEAGRANFEVQLADEILEMGVSAVEFYRNSQPQCTDSSGPPWTCTWEYSNVDNGTQEVIARVMHGTAPGARSNPLNFTVAISGNQTRTLPTTTGLVGFIPEVGTVNGVATQGGLAYLASEEFGLAVVDPNGAGGARVLGSSDVPFHGEHVAVQGNRAVVAGLSSLGRSHFWVLDISTPDAPEVVGEFPTSVTPSPTSGVFDLEVNGSVVVASMGRDGVWALDVSNPASPQHVDTEDTVGTAKGIALNAAGSRIYVADHGNVKDLQVISLSGTGALASVGELDLFGLASDIAVEGNRAYVANQSGRLQTIDISSPSSPAWLGVSATTGTPLQISVRGTTAAVLTTTSQGEHLQLFNVSGNNPTLLGTTQVASVGIVRDIVLDGDAVLLGTRTIAWDNQHLASFDTEASFQVWNVGTPASPWLDQRLSVTFMPRDVSQSGNLVAIAGADRMTGKAALKLVDVTATVAPAVTGVLNTTVNSTANTGFLGVVIDAAHDLAMTAMGADGIWTIDISNPANPIKIGSWNTPGSAYRVALNADATLAYVADHFGDLQIVDISNPAFPSSTASLSLFGLATDVKVVGSIAYVANQSGRLQVIDASNPAAPVLIGIAAITGSAFHVAVEGNTAAVVAVDTHNDWLYLLDVSNPTQPTVIESTNIGASGSATGVSFMNGKVAIAGDAVALYDAQSGLFVEALQTIGDAVDVVGDGPVAYVGSLPGTLSVVHVP